LPIALRADALCVAANCRLELGEWQLARPLFDRGARYDEPQPLAEFAMQIGGLSALAILDIEDPQQPPLDAYGALPTVAELAIERANRVLLLARQKRSVNRVDIDSAKAAIVLCSAYLGRARDGLHQSLTWQASGNAIDAAVQEIANRMRNSGGVLLDHLEVDQLTLHNLLLDATAVIAKERNEGHYSQGDVDNILKTWREHPSVAPHLSHSSWQPLSTAIAKLRR
jgi:hypothetical protein